jgi:hypothetical protein
MAQLYLLDVRRMSGLVEHRVRCTRKMLQDLPCIAIARHLILPAEQEQRRFPKRLRQLIDLEGKGALQTILERVILFGVFEAGAQGLHPTESRPILHHQQRFSSGSGSLVQLRQRGRIADQHVAPGHVPLVTLDERGD